MVGLPGNFSNLYRSKMFVYSPNGICFLNKKTEMEKRVEVECTLFDESWKLNKNFYRKSIVRRVSGKYIGRSVCVKSKR